MNEDEGSRSLPHPCHVHFGHFSSRPYFFGDDHIKVPKGPLIIKTESQTKTDYLADVQSPNRKGYLRYFSLLMWNYFPLSSPESCSCRDSCAAPGMDSFPHFHYPYPKVYICTIQTAYHVGSVCL